MSLLLAGFIVSGLLIALLAYIDSDTEATRAELAASLERRAQWMPSGRTGTAAGALLRIGPLGTRRFGYAPGMRR